MLFRSHHGFSTKFFRINSLVEHLAIARTKGTYLNFIRKLKAFDLLIIDDFGIKPLQPQQFQDIYDIIDERGDRKSMIVTTQIPPENWSEIIPDPVICEAITDRIVSCAYKLNMKGESQRPEVLKKAGV